MNRWQLTAPNVPGPELKWNIRESPDSVSASKGHLLVGTIILATRHSQVYIFLRTRSYALYLPFPFIFTIFQDWLALCGESATKYGAYFVRVNVTCLQALKGVNGCWVSRYCTSSTA
jgi:hypothetical protein